MCVCVYVSVRVYLCVRMRVWLVANNKTKQFLYEFKNRAESNSKYLPLKQFAFTVHLKADFLLEN